MPTASLQPHPRRGLVPPLSDDEYRGLRDDIANRGIQTPLQATEERVVLCGHHRLKAAKELGLGSVPVTTIAGLLDGEQIVHLVLDNVHRRHLSATQRAALLTSPKLVGPLLATLRRDAHERIVAGGRRGGRSKGEAKLPQASRAPQTRDQICELAGVSARTVDLATFAWEHEPERMQAVVEGRSSETVSQIAHEIRRRDKASAAEKAMLFGLADFEQLFKVQLYDVWNFSSLDPGFGSKWPGNIPASLVANVLYHFTEPGDLVLDPMAGGGVTLDVCRALGRECLAGDIKPSSKRVLRHRVESGPLPGTRGRAALVFLDPPYWNLRSEKYADQSSSSLSWREWCAWLCKMARSASAMTRDGGHVACLMQDSLTRQVDRFEGGRSSIVETVRALEDAGLAIITLVACPLPTQQASSYDVEWAKREKRILGINRQLILAKKGST